MSSNPHPSDLTRVVDRLIPLVAEDRRVWVLWVEGDTREAVRRPFAELDLRLGVMDPDFDSVRGELPSLVERVSGAIGGEPNERPWDGVAWDFAAASLPTFRVTLERMSLLGKKPRAHVTPIVDKTGRFRTVLSVTGQRS